MKKVIKYLLVFGLSLCNLYGCSSKSLLDKDNPVTLTMWHVYGEQVNSPMNQLVAEFNETEGKEKGIIINVTKVTNASKIGQELEASLAKEPGADPMPDLYTGHIHNAKQVGLENSVVWDDVFTKKEINNFVDEFLDAGMLEDKLVDLPLSKSTIVFFMNGTQFKKFSNDTQVTLNDFETWDQVFKVAEKYYEWSNGKPLCCFDYVLNSIESYAIALGSQHMFNENGWYNTDDKEFQEAFRTFLEPLIKGHISASDFYSSTQLTTGETLIGVSSSAAYLYLNDIVTYPDNTTEPLNAIALPYPKADKDHALMTQAGVGLCAYKTTEQKQEAASVFAHWLVEPKRNVDFVIQGGYMPVTKKAFKNLKNEKFEDEETQSLYNTLTEMKSDYTVISRDVTYAVSRKAYTFYDQIRKNQSQWQARYEAGEDIDVLVQEAMDILKSLS